MTDNDVYPNPNAPEPGGHSWAEVDTRFLRNKRTCVKFSRFPEDVLPMFVAQMDFPVMQGILDELQERVANSDFGYAYEGNDLPRVFSDFAMRRWGWDVNPEWVYLATDMSATVVEGLRLVVPQQGAKIGLLTPVYPGFFEMLEEFDCEISHIQLAELGEGRYGIDFDALERAFAAGLDAFILCSPHNPHGIVFSREELERLADIAAKYDVFVFSDEVHAPMTYRGVEFVPFAPIAAARGVRCFAATSGSKSWNIAGLKGAWLIAVDEASNELLKKLPPEVATRTSILGIHANTVALRDGEAWLERAVERIEANVALFAQLLEEQVPGAIMTRPEASYLVWLDLRNTALAERPWHNLLEHGKIALGNGDFFGDGGTGFVRVNLACSPDTVRDGVARIARAVEGCGGNNYDNYH